MLSLFCPFQSKGLSHALKVHFAFRIGKDGQRKVQFNGTTDRWKDGSIHKCPFLADVSSVPAPCRTSSSSQEKEGSNNNGCRKVGFIYYSSRGDYKKK
jgi:hypothetical protein